MFDIRRANTTKTKTGEMSTTDISTLFTLASSPTHFESTVPRSYPRAAVNARITAPLRSRFIRLMSRLAAFKSRRNGELIRTVTESTIFASQFAELRPGQKEDARIIQPSRKSLLLG